MNRTAIAIEQTSSGKVIPVDKITCELVGEMSDGKKVWQDIETGEQYMLLRAQGSYFFYKY